MAQCKDKTGLSLSENAGSESPAINDKYEQLQASLHLLGRVIVAFSGGVDSTFLLYGVVETLGAGQVLAVIGNSESYPPRELEEAQNFAENLGAPYRIINTEEMRDERYAANPSNRCYFCKSDLFTRMMCIANSEGYAAVLDGNNSDDVGDWRPGQQAARELGVRSLLIETGLTKAEIRDISRAKGLPTWNKSASACLSSRIPYGSPISPEALTSIRLAEEFLHDLGFKQVRLRHHDKLARIEVAQDEMKRFEDASLREKVTNRLREIGYQYVTLDLQGYRTGSMNELLQPQEKRINAD